MGKVKKNIELTLTYVYDYTGVYQGYYRYSNNLHRNRALFDIPDVIIYATKQECAYLDKYRRLMRADPDLILPVIDTNTLVSLDRCVGKSLIEDKEDFIDNINKIIYHKISREPNTRRLFFTEEALKDVREGYKVDLKDKSIEEVVDYVYRDFTCTVIGIYSKDKVDLSPVFKVYDKHGGIEEAKKRILDNFDNVDVIIDSLAYSSSDTYESSYFTGIDVNIACIGY